VIEPIAKRFERANNPNWPLPHDYVGLGPDAQRQARVAVLRNRETPGDDVASWHLFRTHYLTGPDTGWYDQWVEPAPGHSEWVYNCAKHDRSIIGAHRGSAKSTIFQELCLRDLVTTPYLGPRGWVPSSKTLLILSNDGFVDDIFDRFMMQIEENPYIIEDFGVLKPTKGRGQWNHHKLRLNNRSEIRGASASSTGLRGKRPHRVLIDDIEYDPKEGSNLDKLIADAETLMFQVIVPMLRRGAKLNMIGTPIKRRMLLWRLARNEEKDPRLDAKRWFRKIYPGITSDYTPETHGPATVFWPAENSAEEIEIKRLEWKNFDAEFLCRPGSEGEKPLIVHPKLCLYHLGSGASDPADEKNPLDSTSEIEVIQCERGVGGDIVPRLVTAPACELFKNMTRFITVDPCRKPSPTSDWAALHVIGCDRLNQFWSLDLWAGKVRYHPLTQLIWEYAAKWKVRVIGVECISLEQDMLNQVMDSREVFARQFGWVPQVRPLGPYPKGIDKSSRIQALEWRFLKGLVKLPSWRRGKHPYSMLWAQIEGFDGDADNLDHDDTLDTLAMGQQIIKGAGHAGAPPEEPAPTAIERLKRGDRMHETGMPLTCFIDFNTISQKDAVEISQAMDPMPQDQPGRRRAWMPAGL
jgi:hypothetical protein